MAEPKEGEAMRARGTGSVYQRSGRKPWWIKYYDRNGKAHYESSGSTSRTDAERLLKKRLAEIGSGRRLVGAGVERTTFEELEQLIVDDYRLRRREVSRQPVAVISGAAAPLRRLASLRHRLRGAHSLCGASGSPSASQQP